MPVRPSLPWPAVVGVGLVAAVAAAACATYSDKTAETRARLSAGDLHGGEAAMNDFLRVRRSEELPRKWRSEDALAVLERGMILHALGMWKLSARDFSVAEKELELLDIAKDTAGKIGQYIYSDSAKKYKAPPTEKLVLNAFNMLNYLSSGDLAGARVEAKRFTVMRNYLKDYDPEHARGAFGSYLAGFVFERLGEWDEALRYYDEALQDREFSSLRGPIVRLAARGSYRGERVAAYLAGGSPTPGPVAPAVPALGVEVPPNAGTPATDPAAPVPDASALAPDVAAPVLTPVTRPAAPPAEILVVLNTGRVPYKVPMRIPIGAAVGLAAAFVVGDTTLLEYGLFKVVVYPELAPAESLFAGGRVTIDGQPVTLDLADDLASEITAEYESIKPKIIGAALTRMIVRAGAAEGARAAGNAGKGNALLGFLAAAAIEGALVALDKPDTRSWTTLPSRVDVVRVAVPAGAHRVTVTPGGGGPEVTRAFNVAVPEGGFVVLDVTTLR